MNSNVKRTIVAACLWVLAGTARADIPSYVDFHAIQEQPQLLYPGDTGYANQWSVQKNLRSYDDPVWLDDSWLTIDNTPDDSMDKHLWLEIDFIGSVPDIPFVPYVVTFASVGDPLVTVDPDAKSITWEWILSPQPAWEDIGFIDDPDVLEQAFPVATFDFDDDDTDDIARIQIGVYCIPAPGALLLCGIGVSCLGLRRWLRRS